MVRTLTAEVIQQPTRPRIAVSARSPLGDAGERAFQERLGEHADQWMAALHRTAARRRRVREVDLQGALEPFGIETLAHIFRQRAERRLVAAPHRLQRRPEARQRAIR